MTRKLEVLFWETQIIYNRRRAIIRVNDDVTNEDVVLRFGKECMEQNIFEWIDVEDTEYGDVLDIEDIQIVGEITND
jgi:hypothetical protein